MRNLILFLFVLLSAATASARVRQCFDGGWLFALADDAAMSKSSYDDRSWRRIDLPHDWAIEGDFYAGNPSGAGGGALPGGVGWYRKHFRIDGDAAAYKRHYIMFDGAYMNAAVWLNGHKLGQRPYGYSSFCYDLTPYLNRQGDNVIAVRVDDSDQPNSRWYSGCGIYRHVWLTSVPDLHVAQWGVHVVTTAKGSVTVSVTVADSAHEGAHPAVRNTVRDASGRIVAQKTSGSATQQLKVSKPRLWDVGDPYLYTVTTELIVGGKSIDAVTTTMGFRDYRFDASTGFWLNGRNIKINGVCEHHDFGSLGAAFFDDAMLRKLHRLKDMGVNSIRCTHNPPAPQLLDMCDSLGLIVMDESFDMWRRKKTANDYARYFDDWHERDLTDMVLRDRNHPSVLIWSIGNEVLEQWSSAEADTLSLEQANLILNAGHDASQLARDGETSVNSLLTRHLADIVRRYDTTRPITAGCNEPSPDNHLFKSGALDLIGFNYHHQWAVKVPQRFPGKPFFLSESVSALQTRGYYRMPSDSVFIMPERWDKPYTDPAMMCSAYDNSHVPWGSTHEETWNMVKHTPYCFGQYIWTGFDYIGEPTPFGFPARSSYFGIIDLAGFPKDAYYMYQSEWTKNPVLHLFPHWNWLPGDTVDVWCYYNNADEVELFVNGKSAGVRRKTAGPAPIAAENECFRRLPSDATEFHVCWRVSYEPGEIKAVARKGGRQVGTQTIRTAGSAARIRLSVDYAGKDLTWIAAEVTDKDGNLCPLAENELLFSSDAVIMGVDNGSPFSMERFKDNHRKAFFGKCMIVLKGHGKLRARSVGLADGEISF